MTTKFSIFLILFCMASCLKDNKLKIELNTKPVELEDGWVISIPENEDVNESMLNEAIQRFFAAEDLINSKGLLIAKNGKLILESYCKDLSDRDRKHNIKSVTKSLTSVVTGIAIEKGVIDSNLNRTVYSYIPEHFDANESKRSITLAHCLTMTTGLEDPFYSVAPILPGNPVKTALGVNLIANPGLNHMYNNGSANIIGGVISKESSVSFETFTKINLFDLLDIQDYHWVRHADNTVNPAFDLYLYPRDILKFGQFCLQNGNWQDQQILPENWMAKSTTYYEDGFDGKFGFHWWINETHSCYYANGHGGQRVWIVPNKQLVIVHIAEPSTDQSDLSRVSQLFDEIMMAM